jgi:2-oxoglutarate ferredoxin oxidoreductase subunit alpha
MVRLTPKGIKKMTKKSSDISIVLAGEAGQGVQSIEAVLVKVLRKAGYNVFATKEYMSRVRGGINSTQIRISSKRVFAPTFRTDILVPLTKEAIPHLGSRVTEDTIILGEKATLDDERVLDVPFTKTASEFGNPLFASSVAIGLICGILNVNAETVGAQIEEQFSKKGEEVIKKNSAAAARGHEIGRQLITDEKLLIETDQGESSDTELLLSGTEAVSLGAIAGGCDAVFAYPMTPGSGVFTTLAGFSHQAGIIVEQVEDEIGAINMALGAWYAGGRPLVTTSGGGFSLMTEGMSLAGMTETPFVLHLAQRPGPATGLPTRTEQGDLNLVRYAGHGVFPRIILAPGTTTQAFYLTQKAFNLAAKYQVPVIVLTDQYFTDTYYNIPDFDLSGLAVENHIVEAQDDYKRYALTSNGISARGVPGNGPGRICADSDEHDEEGRITEDLDGISLKMKEKRLQKFAAVQEAAEAPELYGSSKYKTLFVAWGSVYQALKEALDMCGCEDIAMLHFSQVYPVQPKARGYLDRAEKVIAVENNQTGQFCSLLRDETGFEITEKILKYNGYAFASDELAEKIKGVL